MYVFIHRDISVIGNCKSDGTSLGRTLESNFKIFWCSRRSSVIRCSPDESNHENLELELEKSFNPNRREIRILEYKSRNKRS